MSIGNTTINVCKGLIAVNQPITGLQEIEFGKMVCQWKLLRCENERPIMQHIFDDGGRKAAGYQGITGDCACRALAIAAQMPYQEAYDLINKFSIRERKSSRKRGMSSARTGVHGVTMRRVMASLGWTWVPTMGIGTGCKVHLREHELPAGRLVVALSRHYTAVIDGAIHDIYDPQRLAFEVEDVDKSEMNGSRCVYGYWFK